MTFLTQYLKKGLPFAGNDIEASSWEEAETLRPEGQELVGELMYRCDVNGNEIGRT